MWPMPSCSGPPGHEPQPEHGASEEEDPPADQRVCRASSRSPRRSRKPRSTRRPSRRRPPSLRRGPPTASCRPQRLRALKPIRQPAKLHTVQCHQDSAPGPHPSQTSPAATASTTATSATFILIAPGPSSLDRRSSGRLPCVPSPHYMACRPVSVRVMTRNVIARDRRFRKSEREPSDYKEDRHR